MCAIASQEKIGGEVEIRERKRKGRLAEGKDDVEP